VLKKLRRASPSLTETLPLDTLIKTIDTLFPEDPQWNVEITDDDEYSEWKDEYNVTLQEVCNVIKKGSSANKAPGIDEIKSIFLKKIPETFLVKLTTMYNTYLKDGLFPKNWKKAILIPIPKGELDPLTPRVRPICLVTSRNKNFMSYSNTQNLPL